MSGEKRQLPLMVICLSMLGGLAWMVYLFQNSPGVPVHDELGHYFISRDAWQSPKLILDLWGRTVNTLVFMPGSYYGLGWARVSAMAMAVATVLLTLRVAKQLDARYAWLVPALLWFQPWFADLSYTAVTEVPFMLLMAAAATLFLSKRYVTSALVAGLLPLTRHEGIALAGLCLLYFLVRKNWRAAVSCVIPLVVYHVLLRLVMGRWVFAAVYLSVKPTEFYGQGTWSHFVPGLAHSIGAVVCVLAANGLVPMLRSSARLKVLVFYLSYLGLHMVIYRFGLFGSGGYVLFLLPVAPGAAVAAALGLEFIVTHGRETLDGLKVSRRGVSRLATGFIVAVLAAAVVTALETKPRELDLGGRLMKAVAQWLHERQLDKGEVVHSHGWLHFFMPHCTRRPHPITDPDSLPKGTIVVWDYHYSSRYGLDIQKLSTDRERWTPLQTFGRNHVVVFQKRID